jgi:ubiquinone biosynthesis protein
MGLIKTSRQIGRTLKNASRLRTIVGVFAKHGFSNIAERIKLGRFALDRLNARTDIEKFTIPERVRMSFEELGPTFVKLGQLLGSRPDLVPADFVAEFEKLQDRVQPISFEIVEQVLKDEFGSSLMQKFSYFDPAPLGSASIAQVHRARLKDGTDVVIKVQRPGLIQKINDDLNVLYFLAELLEAYVPETRPFNPVGIVDEYFKTLELETNFVVEANNIRRFSQNFKNDSSVKIPQVYFEATTERVLTLEALNGLPLSAEGALSRTEGDSTEVIRRGLRAYLKMVFIDGLFHGDLHAGNFFVLPGNTIGLIDFGVVGRLNHRTQTAIANMLQALAKEDYERLAYEYIDLAPFNDKVNPDLFAKDLRDLIAPFYGLTLKNINLGKILLGSSSIAARHHIMVPTELMLFFKSMVNIEALGKRIQPDFDFLNYALEFAGELVQAQYDPARILSDVSQVLRDSKNLISGLPRQLHYLFKKVNSPDNAFRIQITELEEFRRSNEISFKLIFLGIVIAALLLSSSLVYNHPSENNVAGMPTISFVGYVLAAVFGFIAFINYIRK